MSKQTIEINFKQLAEAIQLTLSAKKHLPTLILIFSAIDILAWLNRPQSHVDVVRDDFIAWVNQYLLPNSNLLCAAIDLYSARCGIVHSYQAESKLTREGKAKQIWYAWGKGNVTRLVDRIDQAKLNNKAVAVQVEGLFDALKKGFIGFLGALDSNPSHATIVYERAAKKLFTDIPHELI